MPSDRDGSTNTSTRERKLSGLRCASEEADACILRARSRSASAQGLSIKPAIRSSTRSVCSESHEGVDEQVRSFDRFDSPQGTESDRLIAARERGYEDALGSAATPFGMTASKSGGGDSVDCTNAAVSAETQTTLSDARLTSRLRA